MSPIYYRCDGLRVSSERKPDEMTMVMRGSVARVTARAEKAESEGRIGEALQLAGAVLADFPHNVEARLVRARGLARTGDMHRAEDELRALLAMNSDNLEVRLALAGVLLLTRRSEEAVDHLASVACQCQVEAAGKSAVEERHFLSPDGMAGQTDGVVERIRGGRRRIGRIR